MNAKVLLNCVINSISMFLEEKYVKLYQKLYLLLAPGYLIYTDRYFSASSKSKRNKIRCLVIVSLHVIIEQEKGKMEKKRTHFILIKRLQCTQSKRPDK